MRGPSESTRERILAAAYHLFYAQGFARVSMDAIAGAAEVTKRTLYNHFASKDELVGSVMEFQHLLALREIESWARNAKGDDPEAMVAMLFSNLKKWASRPNWLGSGFTRMTVELADLSGHPARVAARRHKLAVEDTLESLLAACAVANSRERARQLMILIEGAIGLVLIHGDIDYFDAAAAAGRELVRP